jgi:sterol desaturase/sphingolipid hydroxylase (fatty acid hydroxylase superfamily)
MIIEFLVSLDASNYQRAAFYVFVSNFILFTALQWVSPHHKNVGQDLRNARGNLLLSAMNSLVMSSLTATILLPRVVELLSTSTATQLAVSSSIKPTDWVQIVATVFALDFFSYLWHRANHQVPFLWRFHQVHHSDQNFDTSTAVRFHLGELLMSFVLRATLVVSAGFPLEGLFVYEVLFQFFNIFSHGNISLSERFENLIGRIFITPALHRKHHSALKIDLDTNFGTIFSFWDRLWATYRHGQSTEVYNVGLPEQKATWTLVDMWLAPFKRIQE